MNFRYHVNENSRRNLMPILPSGFIEREITTDVEKATPPRAVVIIGPRQCGKTTLLKRIVEDLPGYTRWLHAENPQDRDTLEALYSVQDFQVLLATAPNLVIDEAQLINGIGKTIKLLVDLNMDRDNPSRIFVTGSSALEIASKTRESAVGRVFERNMWPFSVQELAAHFGWGYVQDNLERFMLFGMLPEVVLHPDSAADLLKAHQQRLVFKDIQGIEAMRKPGLIQNLAKQLALRIGSEVSYDGLAQDLGVSRVTVQNYVGFLELSCIVKIVPSFSRNLGNELKKGKKIYFTDLGVRNAILNDFTAFNQRADRGALWENFFFIERMKIHDSLRDRKDMFFWRTKGNLPRELDFLEVRDNELEAFECKLSAKEKAKPGDQFHKAYPDCKIHVVTPNNALPFLGMKV